MIRGWGASVQTLFDDQFEDVNALPCRSSTQSFQSQSVVSLNSTSNSNQGSSECWYNQRLEVFLADVFIPILGADFLHEHLLLVDVVGSCLLDASSLEPIPTVSFVFANTKSQLYTVLSCCP